MNCGVNCGVNDPRVGKLNVFGRKVEYMYLVEKLHRLLVTFFFFYFIESNSQMTCIDAFINFKESSIWCYLRCAVN